MLYFYVEHEKKKGVYFYTKTKYNQMVVLVARRYNCSMFSGRMAIMAS
jgi:hypothetical protein